MYLNNLNCFYVSLAHTSRARFCYTFNGTQYLTVKDIVVNSILFTHVFRNSKKLLKSTHYLDRTSIISILVIILTYTVKQTQTKLHFMYKQLNRGLAICSQQMLLWPNITLLTVRTSTTQIHCWNNNCIYQRFNLLWHLFSNCLS